MKTVIIPKSDVTSTCVSQTQDCKFYGIQRLNGDKGFITRENYKQGKYIARCLNLLTTGNSFTDFEGDTLQECLCCGTETFTAYEFESVKELLRWLLT